jgi:hypothetical protein
LLAELVTVDYWRLQKGFEYERKYLSPKGGDFHPQGAMPTIIRYMTANRRALEKSFTTLMQLRAQSEAEGRPSFESAARSGRMKLLVDMNLSPRWIETDNTGEAAGGVSDQSGAGKSRILMAEAL